MHLLPCMSHYDDSFYKVVKVIVLRLSLGSVDFMVEVYLSVGSMLKEQPLDALHSTHELCYLNRLFI